MSIHIPDGMIVGMPPAIVAPSILSADFLKLGEAINACVESGIEWFQLDVMDGHFVPNISFGPYVVETCRRATDAFLDVHLMIANPDQYLETFLSAGADLLTIHHEANAPLQPTIKQIKAMGLKAGVAVNPDTPISSVTEVIKDIDLLLVMTIHPGFAGQKFMPASEQRIRQARELLDQHNPEAHLQVDGGVNGETALKAATAGANVFVAATAIFQHPDGISAGIRVLQEAISTTRG